MFVYKQIFNKTKNIIFSESNISQNNITRKYENVLLIGNLIKYFSKQNKGKSHYQFDICDNFALSPKVKFMNVILTNKTRGFYHPGLVKTGLSDGHKVTFSFFRASLKQLWHTLQNIKTTKLGRSSFFMIQVKDLSKVVFVKFKNNNTIHLLSPFKKCQTDMIH